MSPTIKLKKIAAPTPAAVAFIPPVKIPKNPLAATSLNTPFTK